MIFNKLKTSISPNHSRAASSFLGYGGASQSAFSPTSRHGQASKLNQATSEAIHNRRTSDVYNHSNRNRSPFHITSSSYGLFGNIGKCYMSTSASTDNNDDEEDDGMEDEYGEMDSSGETYIQSEFKLESGITLKNAQVRYNVFGELNAAKDNVIVVCHALTGNSSLDEWWAPLLGPDLPFDTSKYAVVCANVLGSCYGSSGPQSINPDTGKAYGNDFPDVTIRDTVALHMQMVKNQLGAKKITAVIGGSMGGMQALEWAIQGEDFINGAMVIGCGPEHTAWQLAISEVQRQAIYADPNWNNGNLDPKNPPEAGLAVARQMAMISYRTNSAYDRKFGRDVDDKSGKFQVRRYLEYQGIKFLSRFDAVTYVKLTEQMDSHDVTRGRGELKDVLSAIHAKCALMAMDSDILYPASATEEMSKMIPNSTYDTINTQEGHDGFLLEYDQVGNAVKSFLEKLEK